MAVYTPMRIPRKPRGGAIPQYTSNVGPYAPGANISARLNDSFIDILDRGENLKGNQIDKLAKAVDKATSDGLNAFSDYSKTKATMLASEYKRRMTDVMTGTDGLLTILGEDAFDGPITLERIRKRVREDLLRDHKGSLSERYFDLQTKDFDFDNALKTVQHSNKEYRGWQDRADENAMQEAADAAIGHYGDPMAMQKDLATAVYHMREINHRNGVPDEDASFKVKKLTSGAYAAAIQRALADDNVAGAQKLLASAFKEPDEKGEGGREHMTQEDAARARQQIRTKQEVLQARAEAAAQRALIAQERKERAEQIRAEKEAKAHSEALQNNAISLTLNYAKSLAEDESLTQAEREARLLKFTTEMRQGSKAAATKAGQQELKLQQIQADAKLQLEMVAIEKAVQNVEGGLLDKLEVIKNSNEFSDAAKAKAQATWTEALESTANTLASARGLVEILTLNSDGMMTNSEVLAECRKRNLNAEDTQTALGYKGVRGTVSIETIAERIRHCAGKKISNADLKAVTAAVYKTLPRGVSSYKNADIDAVIVPLLRTVNDADNVSFFFGEEKKKMYELVNEKNPQAARIIMATLDDATQDDLMRELKDYKDYGKKIERMSAQGKNTLLRLYATYQLHDHAVMPTEEEIKTMGLNPEDFWKWVAGASQQER